MGHDPHDLATTFHRQAEVCRRLQAPWMAELCARCAVEVARHSTLQGLLADFPGEPLRQAVHLRLFGATHALVLDGSAPGLGEFYTANGIAAAEFDQAWVAFLAVLDTHFARIKDALKYPPQTNEVGRTAPLFGGFSFIRECTHLPLSLLELGSSAGLLQLWHRFRYEFSGATFGDSNAAVTIRSKWNGRLPERQGFAIASSRGCDQFPFDVTDPAECARLRSFVWPDHVMRLQTLSSALDLAAAQPPEVERADAAQWVEQQLHTASGTATVLFHAVVWAYLADRDQARILDRVNEIGHAATARDPLFWLRLEDPPEGPGTGFFELRLLAWPDGEDRLLARAEPHGAWVEWLE